MEQEFVKGSKWRVLRNRDYACHPSEDRHLQTGDIVTANGRRSMQGGPRFGEPAFHYDTDDGSNNYIACCDVEPYKEFRAGTMWKVVTNNTLAKHPILNRQLAPGDIVVANGKTRDTIPVDPWSETTNSVFYYDMPRCDGENFLYQADVEFVGVEEPVSKDREHLIALLKFLKERDPSLFDAL